MRTEIVGWSDRRDFWLIVQPNGAPVQNSDGNAYVIAAWTRRDALDAAIAEYVAHVPREAGNPPAWRAVLLGAPRALRGAP